MYSAVLMLALTAGSEAADFGRNRCNGNGSSCGSSCASIVVNACSAGNQVSCSSRCHGRHRLFGSRCHGATACTGVVAPAPTCCAASQTRVRSHGCSGTCSGGRLFGRLFHRGGNGCAATCSTVVIEKKAEPAKPQMEPEEVRSFAPATVVVTLPTNARLIVDGAVIPAGTKVTERRTLVTPRLAVGSTYVYTMRVEVVRDGQTQVQTQNVRVRAGETSAVQFNLGTESLVSR